MTSDDVNDMLLSSAKRHAKVMICGPCNDGICDWMGCSMPGWCSCTEHDDNDEPERNATP